MLIDSLQSLCKLKIKVYAMISNKTESLDYFIKRGIIKTDFSNIRKKDFWWETVPVEYIKRFKKVYGCN